MLAVGVDPITGTIRNPELLPEPSNANLMPITFDEIRESYVVGVENLLNLGELRVFDLPGLGAGPSTGLTVDEAVAMAAEHLETTGGGRWLLGFLSNTGVVESAASPVHATAAAALLKRNGIAGQWVIECFGPDPVPVDHPERGHGYRYPYRQILCTREQGAIDVASATTVTLTMPLSASAVPDPVDACERARTLVLAAITRDFHVMSVSLAQTSSGAIWQFRLYDQTGIVATARMSGDGRRLLSN